MPAQLKLFSGFLVGERWILVVFSWVNLAFFWDLTGFGGSWLVLGFVPAWFRSGGPQVLVLPFTGATHLGYIFLTRS